MSERFYQSPELRVEKIKKYVARGFIISFLCVAPQIAKGQNNAIPTECHDQNNAVITNTPDCFRAVLYDPNYAADLEKNGYIDGFGVKLNILPSNDLNEAYYGDKLIGNVQVMSDGYLPIAQEKAQEEGIDPNEIFGPIAMDSCNPRYLGKIIRIRPLNSNKPFSPKLFDMDCASVWDKTSRNNILKTVADVSEKAFELYKPDGKGIITVELIVEDPNNQHEQDPNISEDEFENYPEKWCEDFRNKICNLDLSNT